MSEVFFEDACEAVLDIEETGTATPQQTRTIRNTFEMAVSRIKDAESANYALRAEVSRYQQALNDKTLVALPAGFTFLPSEEVDRLREVEKNYNEVNEDDAREHARLTAIWEEHEQLLEDIDGQLPKYILDDGTKDPASTRETIECAGEEIERLRKEVARLRGKLHVQDSYLLSADERNKLIGEALAAPEIETLRAKAALCDEIALDVKCQTRWLERYAAIGGGKETA